MVFHGKFISFHNIGGNNSSASNFKTRLCGTTERSVGATRESFKQAVGSACACGVYWSGGT